MSLETYKQLEEHFSNIAEALFKTIKDEKYTENTDEEDNYYILRLVFTSLNIKNKDKFYTLFFKEVIDKITEDGRTIHHQRVKDVYKMIHAIDAKLKDIVFDLESNKQPEDFNLLIYKRDIEYPDVWSLDMLKFLTKIIPNSDLTTKETKTKYKVFLNVKFSKKYSITEYFKKKKERKKKVKAFESVLEKALAVKRINKFLTRVGEGIISRRPFDSLVFY